MQVRSLSTRAVSLTDADGVAASRLPAGRRFTSCTRLTYTCSWAQQQHLAALAQVLEHAATCMPQVASLKLRLKQQVQQRVDTSLDAPPYLLLQVGRTYHCALHAKLALPTHAGALCGLHIAPASPVYNESAHADVQPLMLLVPHQHTAAVPASEPSNTESAQLSGCERNHIANTWRTLRNHILT